MAPKGHGRRSRECLLMTHSRPECTPFLILIWGIHPVVRLLLPGNGGWSCYAISHSSLVVP